MRKNFRNLFTVSLLLSLVLAGCTMPSEAAPPPTEVKAPVETQAHPTDVPTSTPVPTATPIQHESVPGDLPPERSSQAGDHDSSVTADQKRAPGGDRFTFGRYERPFNTETMDVYFPYLDIQDTLIYQDDTWIYAVITLESGDADQKLAGRYGFEIDADVDGGGDWLILVASPSSTEWSTQGVQVWFDMDDDVGGTSTVNADENAPGGNGYETMLFDSDQGEDPDLAWARISPNDLNSVHLAVKRSLLDGDDAYMAGMWAGNGILDPALFDLNDHFTHEQAGAALTDLEYFYPIKAISELDNSCRMPVGFAPNGSEPGSCPVAASQSEGACPSQQFVCYNFGNQQVCVCAP